MIECIFTLDYEIYGNGEGSLRELIYDPAEKLMAIFSKAQKRFVAFIEVAELEMIETEASDPAIGLVKRQIQDLYKQGFELGLHLHPQWCNARHENKQWRLDYNEYNLCTLPHDRITQIIDRSITYFRNLLNDPDFTPLSFRAGNWLFQPTQTVANILAKRGTKIDSSVFKGGLQRQHKLDYRPSLRNGHYWRFTDDVNVPDPQGILIELPIYTKIVPAWKMLTSKRVGLQQKAAGAAQAGNKSAYRYLDFLRFRQPLKFDFCRMNLDELTDMVDAVIKEDQQAPKTFRPIVAIGHTKDLVDFETVEDFLSYLGKHGIKVSTLEEVYEKITVVG